MLTFNIGFNSTVLLKDMFKLKLKICHELKQVITSYIKQNFTYTF